VDAEDAQSVERLLFECRVAMASYPDSTTRKRDVPCPEKPWNCSIAHSNGDFPPETLLSQYEPQVVATMGHPHARSFKGLELVVRDGQVKVVCGLCLVEISTSSIKRSTSVGRDSGLKWEMSWNGNVVNHAVTKQHHASVVAFLRGYAACMKMIANCNLVESEAVVEPPSGDVLSLSRGYDRLTRYLAWREQVYFALMGGSGGGGKKKRNTPALGSSLVTNTVDITPTRHALSSMTLATAREGASYHDA
jgi:hypothetical protein